MQKSLEGGLSPELGNHSGSDFLVLLPVSSATMKRQRGSKYSNGTEDFDCNRDIVLTKKQQLGIVIIAAIVAAEGADTLISSILKGVLPPPLVLPRPERGPVIAGAKDGTCTFHQTEVNNAASINATSLLFVIDKQQLHERSSSYQRFSALQHIAS